jgi:hypothetical protein
MLPYPSIFLTVMDDGGDRAKRRYDNGPRRWPRPGGGGRLMPPRTDERRWTPPRLLVRQLGVRLKQGPPSFMT